MFSVKKLVAISLATCALVSSVSAKAAVSHVFQSTPDYTISHKQFHDHVVAATPFLDSLKAESHHVEYPSSIDFAATVVNPYASHFYEHQTESYVAEPVSISVTQKPRRQQDILPPGYVALAGMIDPPPGYQLFPKDRGYY